MTKNTDHWLGSASVNVLDPAMRVRAQETGKRLAKELLGCIGTALDQRSC
jgi:hypothetical protein